METLESWLDASGGRLLYVDGTPLVRMGSDEPLERDPVSSVPGFDLAQLGFRSSSVSDHEIEFNATRFDVTNGNMVIRRRTDSPWFVIIETYRWPVEWTIDGEDFDIYGARITLKCYPSSRMVLQRYVPKLSISRELAIEDANAVIVEMAQELAVMADE